VAEGRSGAGGGESAPRDASGSESAPRDASGSGSPPRDASGSESAPRDASGSGSAPRGDSDLPSVSAKRRAAPKGEPPPRPSLLADPPVTEAAAHVETKAGKEQSQILLGRIFEREADDLAPLIAATMVLSKRVTQDLRESRGLAYGVGCSLEDFGAKAWFTASMGTRPENLDVAEAGLREAIQRFSTSTLDPREVERAVNAMRGQMAMRRMTRISQAYSLGFNELLCRDTTFDAKLDAALGAVTPAEILRVARRYLDPARMVTAIAR